MSQTASPSVHYAYGLARVCRAWEVPRSSVYAARQRHTRPPVMALRRGPKTALADAELTDHIRRVIQHSPFLGEGYRKAWARLRVAGIRTSRQRVLRLIRHRQPAGAHPSSPRASSAPARRPDHDRQAQ